MDFFLHIKLRKAKIKTLQDKVNFCNADADADINANSDAEMPIPRFPNGRSLPHIIFSKSLSSLNRKRLEKINPFQPRISIHTETSLCFDTYCRLNDWFLHGMHKWTKIG